jgi:hypothetical protein
MVTGERLAVRLVTSQDGTRIAYETWGQGPALIAVGGTTCDRALMRSTAQALGEYFATINYDRRGRGESGDTARYAIDREIEDIAALINEARGSVLSKRPSRTRDLSSIIWAKV